MEFSEVTRRYNYHLKRNDMILLAGAFLCLILLIATANADAIGEQLDEMDAEKNENRIEINDCDLDEYMTEYVKPLLESGNESAINAFFEKQIVIKLSREITRQFYSDRFKYKEDRESIEDIEWKRIV